MFLISIIFCLVLAFYCFYIISMNVTFWFVLKIVYICNFIIYIFNKIEFYFIVLRYLEAIELNKSLDGVNKSKYNDDLIITSLLVSGFEKTIPKTMRQCYNRPFLKNVYKKTGLLLSSCFIYYVFKKKN